MRRESRRTYTHTIRLDSRALPPRWQATGGRADPPGHGRRDLRFSPATLALFVGSNVLFVGTINEDESKQTLSDMVVDRVDV